MDILSWVVLVTVVLLAAAFNYYLNLAPGADPEDFQVGPPQLGITCDCPLNIIIIGGIIALALSAVSGFFNSRTELIIAGIISFSLITIAGYIGRNRRHKEWRELHKAIERSIPSTAFVGYQRAPTDITFEDEDDEDFDEYFDEY